MEEKKGKFSVFNWIGKMVIVKIDEGKNAIPYSGMLEEIDSNGFFYLNQDEKVHAINASHIVDIELAEPAKLLEEDKGKDSQAVQNQRRIDKEKKRMADEAEKKKSLLK